VAFFSSAEKHSLICNVLFASSHCERVCGQVLAMNSARKMAPPCQDTLVHFTGDGDAGLAEGVGHLRVAQARSVVFERQLVHGVVDAEAAQPVGVREFAQMAQLVFGERGLQFVGNLDECHGGIITRPGKAARAGYRQAT